MRITKVVLALVATVLSVTALAWGRQAVPNGFDEATRAQTASATAAATQIGAAMRAIGDQVTTGGTSCAATGTGPTAFGDPELHVIDLDGGVRCTTFAVEKIATPGSFRGSDWLVALRKAPPRTPVVVTDVPDAVTHRPVVILVASRLPGDRYARVGTIDVEGMVTDMDARVAGQPMAPYFTIANAERSHTYARSNGNYDERIWGEAKIDSVGWLVSSGVFRSEALAAAHDRQARSVVFAAGLMLAMFLVQIILYRRSRSDQAAAPRPVLRSVEEPREEVGVGARSRDELIHIDGFVSGVGS